MTNNRHFSWYNFNNFGYILYKFTDEELSPIWKEINKIKNDFDNSTTWNHQLAGHLKHEYKLADCKDHVCNLIKPLTVGYDKTFDYYKSFSFLTSEKQKTANMKLDSLWVNFQKKGEFNPVHDHGGILSFVIWLKMPYNIEDESKYFQTSINSEQQRTATFNFYHTNALGNITNTCIPADKKYENTICIFPSKMKHAVYPFYTSDDYRISVSGNFYLHI